MHKFLTLSFLIAGTLAGSPAWPQMMGGGGMGGPPPGGGRPGGGQRPDGAPPMRPGPPQIATAQKLNGLLSLTGESLSVNGKALAAIKPDQSVVLLTQASELHLSGSNLTSDLPVTSLPEAQSAGLGAAVLVLSQSRADISGGSVTTRQAGVPAVYVADPGSSVQLTATRLATHNSYASGVVVAGGELTTQDAELTTASDNAPALDLRFGAVHLAGGRLTAAGPLSPAIAVAGEVEATGVVLVSQREAAIEVKGAHRLRLTDAQLTGGADGVRVVAGQTMPALAPRGLPQEGMSGGPPPGGYGPARQDTGGKRSPMGPRRDGPPPQAELAFSGGAISARLAVFSVTGAQVEIVLNNVALDSGSGQLAKVTALSLSDQGLTLGHLRITASGQSLNGDIVTDAVSSAVLDLKDCSRFSGRTTANVDVSLDAGSTWTLTGDGRVGKLTLAGDPAASLIGNGHSLAYDPARNPDFGGQTYELKGGGQLLPAKAY
ncbi:hypothetical protein ABAC460_00460 [Asticcacaulis sp. AC460]|uniref:hypothetical protein n=1 Tax=Asticcacaulis sp. AC460 TaxID=1282360 RepID=UPI0003C3AF74|nr:hypothetical protein [Asticcacaulis sp. AC460]ESQ93574.1 hypothetical protein ABAC460_00460 [Asticcacaulis sp. AC460]